MSSSRNRRIVLGALPAASFAVLLLIGREIYRQAPPLPLGMPGAVVFAAAAAT